MPHETLLIALLAAGLVWLWFDSMRARERVIVVCTRACKQMDVQLLDQTVALARMRLRRDRGRLKLAREYGFEFSTDGADRWGGRASMLGGRVTGVQLEGPEGVVIL